jgi:hypothetical protein
LWLDKTLMQDVNEVISLVASAVDYLTPKSLDNRTLGGLKGHFYSGIDHRITEYGLTFANS